MEFPIKNSEYDQEIPQSQTADNPVAPGEEPLNHHETLGRQIKQFDFVKSGWSIVYIEGSQVIISKKNIIFLSLKIDFVLALCRISSGSSLFAKVPVLEFLVLQGLSTSKLLRGIPLDNLPWCYVENKLKTNLKTAFITTTM